MDKQFKEQALQMPSMQVKSYFASSAIRGTDIKTVRVYLSPIILTKITFVYLVVVLVGVLVVLLCLVEIETMVQC